MVMIAKITSYSMLLLGIIFFFLMFWIKGFNQYIYLVLFLSFIVSILSHKFLEKRNIGSFYLILVDIALWLNILGEFYFYYNWQYYDKILHIIIPMFITLIGFEYFKKNYKINKLLIFLSVMGGLVLFEIFEYLIFTFLKYPMMGVFSSTGETLLSPLDDTFIDLICGMIASLLVIFFKRGEQ